MNQRIATLWMVIGLLSSVLYAQSWGGAEAVALQVNDAKGRAVPSARVVFTFQGIPGELGPDIVATDTKGRAVVAGLAPGPWQVEVIHPDYLSFIAMIDVRRDKKPLISASFLQAGGRSLNPVKVKVSKGDERQASPALEARAPAPEQVQVAEVPPPTAAPVESPSMPEPVAPEPMPTPEPTQEVVAESIVEPEAAEAPVPPPVPAPTPAPTPDADVAVEEAVPQSAAAVEEASTTGEEELTAEAMPVTEMAEAPAAVPTSPEIDEPMASPELKAHPDSEPPVPTEREAPAVVAAPSVPKPAEVPQPEIEPIPTEVPAPDSEDAPEAAAQVETIAPPEEPPAEAESTRVADADPIEAAAEPAQAAPSPSPVSIAPSPPAVAVSAMAAPVDPGSIVTSHRDGSCADCETAEWTLQVSAPVPAASPGSAGSCDAGVLDAARPAMQELASSIQLELQGFIGPIANGTQQAAVRYAESDMVAPFQGPLTAFVGGTSPCQIVGLVLPKEVRFSRVAYAAADQQGSGGCAPGQDCSIGDAAWLGSARVERGPSATVIYGLFENRSGERARRAFLTAYYRPPSARWQPRLPAAD